MQIRELFREPTFALKESVSNQHGFEALAKAILDLMAETTDADAFAYLGDAAPRLDWNRLSPGMQEFISERGTLEVSLLYADTTGRGFYRRRNGICWIALTLPKASKGEITSAIASGPAQVRTILNRRYSTLVHELAHAYDDWISDGRFSKADTHAQSVDDYLNDPAEINARYYQVVSALDLGWDWKTFAHAFKTNFSGWTTISEEAKKRLLRRLGAYYTSGRQNSG